MSLEKWAEYGWLKREATSLGEIQSLLTIVDRDLKDASVAAISEDRRFEAAFKCRSDIGQYRLEGVSLSHVDAGRASHKDH